MRIGLSDEQYDRIRNLTEAECRVAAAAINVYGDLGQSANPRELHLFENAVIRRCLLRAICHLDGEMFKLAMSALKVVR
jgi:hypothetical protein